MIPGTNSIFSFDTVHRGSNIFSGKKQLNGQFTLSRLVEKDSGPFEVLVEYMPGLFKTIPISSCDSAEAVSEAFCTEIDDHAIKDNLCHYLTMVQDVAVCKINNTE